MSNTIRAAISALPPANHGLERTGQKNLNLAEREKISGHTYNKIEHLFNFGTSAAVRGHVKNFVDQNVNPLVRLRAFCAMLEMAWNGPKAANPDEINRFFQFPRMKLVSTDSLPWYFNYVRLLLTITPTPVKRYHSLS